MTIATKTTLGSLAVLVLLAAGFYLFTNTTVPEKGISPNDSVSTPAPTNETPNPAGTVETGSSDEQKCTSQGGTWSQEHHECTGISAGSCQEIGGTFNECESACRHNPNAEVCIQMCVAVCTIK